jgi:hypothetical protein
VKHILLEMSLQSTIFFCHKGFMILTSWGYANTALSVANFKAAMAVPAALGLDLSAARSVETVIWVLSACFTSCSKRALSWLALGVFLSRKQLSSDSTGFLLNVVTVLICHFTLNAVVNANPHRGLSWALVANKVCVRD